MKDGGSSILVFEEWMQTGDPALLAQIDEYNREDCIATLLLRDWLLGCATSRSSSFGPFPPVVPEEPKEQSDEAAARAALAGRLLDAGEDVAAHLLDYHRPRGQAGLVVVLRAARDDAGRAARGRASRSAGLEVVGGPEQVQRSKAWTFTFPAQEFKLARAARTCATRPRAAGRAT